MPFNRPSGLLAKSCYDQDQYSLSASEKNILENEDDVPFGVKYSGLERRETSVGEC